MSVATPLTRLLGIRHPIIQGGMSWASSNAELALAVSRAGALGVIAAGPMYPDALRAAIRAVRAGTDAPFAVNVPLYNKRANEFLGIVLAERVPILIASQGGPKGHIDRFKAAGVKWLHVAAAPEHAAKAESLGVDAIIAVGVEAGGHPGPEEVGTVVLTRAVVRAVAVPVIASGGIADGAGIAAMLALGAAGAQLGTRFLMTDEAGVHADYKAMGLAARVSDTALVGRGRGPIRQFKNAFSTAYQAAERAGRSDEALAALLARANLKMAALEGDVQGGKTEIGQAIGLVDDIVPAGELVARLAAELDAALRSLRALAG